MKFLDTTAGSTHATDAAVKLYLPPDEAATVLAIFDRYQALEIKRPDPGHARKTRSQNIEVLVMLALDNETLNAKLKAADPWSRTALVRNHLATNADRYNITKPPHPDTVRAILRKHNWL